MAIYYYYYFGVYHVFLVVRNAYILIDFGDFVDGSSSKVGSPYVQLLSVTQPALAHQDFVQSRLGGVDNTSDFHLLPATNTTSDPDGDDDDSSSSESWWNKYKWYIIGGAAGLAVLVLVLSLWGCSRRKKPAYRQLNHPAPAGLDNEPMFARYQPGGSSMAVPQGRGQSHARFNSESQGGSMGGGYAGASAGYVPPGPGYAPSGYAPPRQRY